MTLALSVGILAAIWTWLTVSTFDTFHILVWVTFISWAAFFIAGASKKAIMSSIYPLISGTILGWLCIVVMNLLFNGFNLPILSLLVGTAAFLIVIMAKIPQLASAPTQFLGFAAFFGAFFGNAFGPVSSGMVALFVAWSLIAGVIIGFISVSLPQALTKADSGAKS